MAGPDQNAEGCAGGETEHESQIQRADIPMDGRVVSRIDHTVRKRPHRRNRVQRGSLNATAPVAEFGEKIMVRDVKEHEQEWAES